MIAGPNRVPQQDRIDIARREGAVAVIQVTFGDLIKPSYIAAFEKETIPVVTITPAVANELIAVPGFDVSAVNQKIIDAIRRAQYRPSLRAQVLRPISFDPTARIRLSVPPGKLHQLVRQNVVGTLRGSDPVRADPSALAGRL